MKSFQIRHIGEIELEGTHDLPNSRQTLATIDDLVTDNIDALTKGILKPGQKWDWHKHEEYDELGIVIAGTGKFYWEGNDFKNLAHTYGFEVEKYKIQPGGGTSSTTLF